MHNSSLVKKVEQKNGDRPQGIVLRGKKRRMLEDKASDYGKDFPSRVIAVLPKQPPLKAYAHALQSC